VIPVLVPATLSWLSALALAAYVGLRRDKQDFHWLVFGLLLTLVVWMTGTIVRTILPTPAGVVIGVHLVFLGALSAPPLWLLLAAHHAQARFAVGARMQPLIVALPTALFFLALLTNDGHHLLLRDLSPEARARGPVAFAGPLFWVFVTWAAGCTVAGAGCFLFAAGRMASRSERRRGVVLAVAALLPMCSSAIYLFQIVPVTYDTTPFGFTATLVILSVLLFRYELLESLPLAREDVLRHLEDGVVVADAAGRVVTQNPSALRILNADAADLRGFPLGEALARLATPGARAARRDERGGDAGGPEFETADGRCIEISGGVLRDGTGEELGRFAMLRDRTEERRYERSVRQIQKLETVGALAAGVAREVNDPLAFVRSSLGEIERLGARVAAGAEGRDALLAQELRDLRTLAEEARAGVDRIARLVEDMRLLFHGAASDVNEVEMKSVVEDALHASGLDRQDAPRVVVSEEGELPHVRGSAERLTQALVQLLENARTALSGAADPVIRVALRRAGESLELEVSDNGPGVPEHLRERIFDPFFTTRAPDQGTGLGLALAFDVAREHGGVLEERSARGSGATFVLRLPFAQA
jgi:signal transduction histidine kinase